MFPIIMIIWNIYKQFCPLHALVLIQGRLRLRFKKYQLSCQVLTSFANTLSWFRYTFCRLCFNRNIIQTVINQKIEILKHFIPPLLVVLRKTFNLLQLEFLNNILRKNQFIDDFHWTRFLHLCWICIYQDVFLQFCLTQLMISLTDLLVLI